MNEATGSLPSEATRPTSVGSNRTMEKWQYSGWLQFIAPFMIALPLAALGLLFLWTGWDTGAWITGGVAGLLIIIGAFDIAVIKLRLVSLPDRTPRPVVGDAFSVMSARRACRSFQPLDLTTQDRDALDALLAKHTGPDCAHSLAQGVVRAACITTPIKVWPGVGAQQFLVVLGPATYDRVALMEAGRALQHVVNALTARGVATCWIGPGAERESVAAALGPRFDPAEDHVICVIALGYASRYIPLALRVAGLASRRRKQLSDLVYEDAPGLPAPLYRPPYKSLIPVLSACRWAPSSHNAQTTRLLLHQEDGHLTRAAFCSPERSRFYAPIATGIWAANWEAGMAALGRPGQLRARRTPTPLAGGLVQDLDWKPGLRPEV